MVEKWKRDTKTLLANVKRIKTYEDADKVREAWKVFRKRLEALIFKGFLNKELNNMEFRGEISESTKHTINRYLRSRAWDFVTESFPVGHPDAYWTKEQLLHRFLRERDQWLRRVRRLAKLFFVAWDDVFEVIGYMHEPITDDQGGIPVPVRDRYQTEVVGFKAVFIGYDPNDKYHVNALSSFEEALRLYRKRASKVLPWLVKNQLPLLLKFDCELDEGGRYNHNGTISVCPTGYSGSVGEGVRVMAHEMGHHLWQHLSGQGRDYWRAAVRKDWGPLDLEQVYAMWPDNMKYVWQFAESLRETNPDLSLQLEIVEAGRGMRSRKPFSTKEELRQYIDAGNPTVVVPKNPITAYADKNPEESFCEAIGMLVGFGPRAVHDIVLGWLREVVPGVRVASDQSRRVAALYIANEVLGPAPQRVSEVERWLPRHLRGKAYRGTGETEAMRVLGKEGSGSWWTASPDLAVYYARKRHGDEGWLLVGYLRPEDKPQLDAAESLYDRPTVWAIELATGQVHGSALSKRAGFLQNSLPVLSFQDLPSAAKKALQQYGMAFPNGTFYYGTVPTKVLVRAVMKDNSDIRSDFSSWDEYHQWYLDPERVRRDPGRGTPPGAKRWPIILSHDPGEVIEDGWHRFHQAVEAGARELEVVALADTGR